MNHEINLEEMKEEYNNIKIPDSCLKRMQMGMDKAKMEKKHADKKRIIRNWTVSVTAAAIIFVVLPNTSQTVAQAMEKIPIIGDFVRVITFYRYEVNEGTMEAKVEVPQIETEKGKEEAEGVKKVNEDIKAYTDKLIQKFNKDMEANGEHEGLDVSYKVILDDKKVFSLKISALETMASSAETIRYYHLDKDTGKIIELKDLFQEGADYVTPISNYIKQEMRKQMKSDDKIYFLDSEDMPENDFKKLKTNQNFYLKKDGSLVISFDEYEVAPGFMGSPEFEIPKEIIQKILK